MFLPDLLVWALRRDPHRPAIFLGEEVLSVGQLGAQISRYAQVYAAQGVAPGSGIAMLSVNRPEVLFAIGAYMVSGCRNTPCTRSDPWTTTPTSSRTPASRHWSSTRASPSGLRNCVSEYPV